MNKDTTKLNDNTKAFLTLNYKVMDNSARKGQITKANKTNTAYFDFGTDFKKMKAITIGSVATIIEGFSKENVIVILNNKGKAFAFAETTYTEKDKLNCLHESVRDASAQIYVNELKGNWKANKKTFSEVVKDFKGSDKSDYVGRIYYRKEEQESLDIKKNNNLPYMVTDKDNNFVASPLHDSDMVLIKNDYVYDAYLSMVTFKDKYLIALKKALIRLQLIVNDTEYINNYVSDISTFISDYNAKLGRVGIYNEIVSEYRERATTNNVQ